MAGSIHVRHVRLFVLLAINEINRLGALGHEGVSLNMIIVDSRNLSLVLLVSLVLDLVLETRNGKLKEFVLSLGLKDLLLKEISLLLEVVGLALPLLDALSLFHFFLFHSDLIVSNALDRLLKVVDFVVFQCTVCISFIQLIYEVPQLLLLPLDVDIVTLKIFILLLGQQQVKFII